MSIAPPELLVGSQVPTHRLTPVQFDFTLGPQFVELGEMMGVEVDPWQSALLDDGLAMRETLDAAGKVATKFTSYEVGIELSRQNGKSVVLELRLIGGLWILGERRVTYSAHLGDTVMEEFDRIVELIYRCPEMLREVRRIHRTNGKEAIELWSGQKMKFRTRTNNGGRGLAGQCVVLDESQDLVDASYSALLPITSAMPNAQLWYAGSAGTKRSVVQGRLVRRSTKGSPRFTYWRFAGEDLDPDDPRTWARVNPALGRRIAVETIETEHDAMSTSDFSHERLGVGDYPREEGEDWVIPRSSWEAAADSSSEMVGPVLFSLEVKWDRTTASVGVAGRRADGRKHIELVRTDPTTTWCIPELLRLATRHMNLGVVIDPSSPAANMVLAVDKRGGKAGEKTYVLKGAPGIPVHLLRAGEAAKAFGDMYDALVAPADDLGRAPKLHHTGGSLLTSSMAQAEVRTSAGALTWRRNMSADTTPTMAVCWAAFKLDELLKPKRPPAKARRATPTRRSANDIRNAGF